jgi:O-antigen/teichoic acid export membrane protein
LIGEFVTAAYFWRLFVRLHGAPKIVPDWRGLRSAMKPILMLGAGQCLGLVNYNLDSILIGIMLGAGPVGWYAAAYKPITAVLAVPVTYYQGLFPALSRSYAVDRERFRGIVMHSLRLTAIFAFPLGIGGSLLAEPVIRFLFGPSYLAAVPALQLLSWSAVLVTLRGNFRHTLNAIGKQRLDLTCAASAAAANVILNLLLIPRYGIAGAAAATVGSEIGWFVLAWHLFSRHAIKLPLAAAVWRPIAAGAAMAATLLLAGQVQWMLRAVTALAVYAAVLIVSGEPALLSARRSFSDSNLRVAGAGK